MAQKLMTDGQEKHLAHILDTFDKECAAKYRRGQREHGGNLYDSSTLTLVDEALKEAIDQVVYLVTLRDKIIDGMKGPHE